MTDNYEIPTYTKVGFRVTIIILLIIGFIMLKNCVSSVNYATKTSDAEINESYQIGFEAGVKKARGKEMAEPDDYEDNPLLKKMYQKGFRNGWDSVSPQRAEK